MIGWIKYPWGCDWSKENDIFDSCQVLSQHESEILNDLDQRLSFLSSQCFVPIKNKRGGSRCKICQERIKESLWGHGSTGEISLALIHKNVNKTK